MVARQHDDAVLSCTAKNLQGPEMYLHAKFGCSSPDGVGGVSGQRHKQTD